MLSSNRNISLPRSILLIVSVLMLLASGLSSAEIVIQATPDGGFQPRLIVDAQGDVHLLYFKKRLRAPSAREGNLYYRQYLTSEKRFGLPVKVSSEAYNLQTFSVARASLAIDGEGRIHVVWYRPKANQYFYTRSNSERNQFETQRAMVAEYSEGLDATADVAALGSKVAIVWAAGSLAREYERTVYARISNDFGASFGSEIRIGNPDIGACACCSLATDYADEDDLRVAYRSAIDGIGRHMQLLSLEFSEGNLVSGAYAEVSPLQEWELSACPLSTNDIALDNDAHQWLVFETQSRIVQIQLVADAIATAVAEPFSRTRQKNPVLAINAQGDRLIVWGEAISHSKGGRLNMKLFSADGTAKDFQFSDDITMQNFTFPAAVTLPDGDFLVLH
ncbi:MAG: hypothetical protein COA96_15960 [SAR86 cluster bacterium]|uniref:Exo-alpha-sialidase n=1 Tax=SAR86 cluster bacterium TaxID=2030880 RepID=A0A2A5AMC8_9GAMM|nr:MAG: hypothetical protein COA96_15960 [SAR86 cluster bacterium]